MLELLLIILAIIAVTYGVFLVMRLVLPVFALALGVVYFLANILLIFFIIQAAIWFVFYPPLKSHFNGVAFSMLQIVTVVTIITFVALILVIAFGKSLAFKQYGVLSVIINSFTTIFIILSIYRLSKESTANFGLANLHCKEAVFTLAIYLTSINISTYLFYGYDKFRAWIFPKTREYGDPEPPLLNHWGQKLAHWVERFAPWIKTARVPEWVLHWHSICGGSLGASFAQKFFRHKTKKKTFQAIYLKIVIAQTVLLVGTFFLIKKI